MERKEIIKLAAALVIKAAQSAADDPDSGAGTYEADIAQLEEEIIQIGNSQQEDANLAATRRALENATILQEEIDAEKARIAAEEAARQAWEDETFSSPEYYALQQEALDHTRNTMNQEYAVPSVMDIINQNVKGGDWDTQSGLESIGEWAGTVGLPVAAAALIATLPGLGGTYTLGSHLGAMPALSSINAGLLGAGGNLTGIGKGIGWLWGEGGPDLWHGNYIDYADIQGWLDKEDLL